jgi:hypothetical protein
MGNHHLTNVHPVDQLAAVRSQIKALEEEEAALRQYLLEHEADRVGDLHIAQIGTWPRKQIDLKGLAGQIGEAVLQKFTTKLSITTIRLKPRAADEG